MSFLHPILLAGLAGALVPWILHLLNLARARSVDWGAMLFLNQPPVRRQSGRLRQVLVLAVRTLLVALLALAFARPVLSTKPVLIPAPGGGRIAQPNVGDAPATVVILLDQSASMGLIQDGRAPFAEARQAAISILSNLHPGDEAVVLGLAGPGGRDPQPTPTADLRGLAVAVGNLSAGGGASNIARALQRGADLLAASERANRQLYLICDRQAASWSGVDASLAAGLKTRFAHDLNPPRLFVLPVGPVEISRLTVNSINLDSPCAITDQPTALRVLIHNYGKDSVDDVPLTLKAGDKILSTLSVSVPGSSEITLRPQVRLSSVGTAVLSASLADESTGSEAAFAVDVTPPLPILLLAPKSDRPISASECLRLAMAPFAGANEAESDPLSVTLCAATAAPWDNLSLFRAIVLCDPGNLTKPQVQALHSYVYTGGGLFINPDVSTNADKSNAMLLEDGLLSAALSAGQSTDSSARWQFPLSAPPLAGGVRRYFPCNPRSPAQVVGRLNNGQPVLVAAALGEGRTLLCTVPLTPAWTDLPTTRAFVPFVQSAVEYLASANSARINLATDEPIQLDFDAAVDGNAARLIRPDGSAVETPLQRWAGHTRLRYADTDQTGAYQTTLRVNGVNRTFWFVVQRPAAEADLTPLTAAQWQAFEDELGLVPLELKFAAGGDGTLTSAPDVELWPWLLAAAMGVALLELVIGRWLGAAPVSTRHGGNVAISTV